MPSEINRVRPRSRALVAVAAVLAGMAAGAGAYYGAQLTGVTLYVLTGGVTALLGAAIWEWFTRSAAISEVEVAVPQLSRITFAVSKDHRLMARRIVVQMTSRVAVQPLDEDSGRADEAITSLHALFTFVRDLLDEDAGSRTTPGRPKVDVLALNMINCQLRPFLGRWHRKYDDWRAQHQDAPESEWPEDARFRTELRELQSQLRPRAIAFARIAEYEDYVELIGLGHDGDRTEK